MTSSNRKIPRILLTAGASGSGKTLITCGLLQVLKNRGFKIASFKCGPDYIDPMFHSRVIGAKSRNLDTFFTSGERTRYLLGRNAADCDIAVMEGVMGFYDGVGGTTVKASAYDLAKETDTPVIFIVNSKGMSVSLAAYIKGFLDYKKDSRIKGVIFNQMSPMLYPRMKKLVEEELGVRVLGYVPKVEDCVIESRHLGLVLPDEIPELQNRLRALAGILEETLDIEGILALAQEAEELQIPTDLADEDEAFRYRVRSENEARSCRRPDEGQTCPCRRLDEGEDYSLWMLDKAEVLPSRIPEEKAVRIGVASDEAFCFFYEDNFRLLREMGAELVFFSPIHDSGLPENLDGLLLCGGYPELNGKALEDNEGLREEIAFAISQGMPCMAECGGFMYLHEQMEGMDGKFYRMAGVIPGKAYRTPKLTRFGYITLEQKGPVFGDDALGSVPAHEFHYFDSESCGESFHASKPMSSRGWDCIHGSDRLFLGFPHLYYYANPRIPRAFLRKCLEYRREQGASNDV